MHICRRDADTKIISTSLELSEGSNVIVVPNDTDVVLMLLFKLCFHFQN